MTDHVSIELAVELLDDQLALRIPLGADGDRLIPLARGIGEVIGEHLIVVLKPGIAEVLSLKVGSRVIVNNKNGEFTLTQANSEADPDDPDAPYSLSWEAPH